MSGLLSSIFDDGATAGDRSGMGDDAGLRSLEEHDGSHSASHSDTGTVDGHAAHDIALDPHVGIETGGTYSTPDGHSTSWTHSDEVGAHVDVDAALAATSTVSEATMGDHGG